MICDWSIRNCWRLAAVIALCLILPACESKNTKPSDRSSDGKGPEAAKNAEREGVLAEREKLLNERLELERQRADIERQKREALESKIREQQAAEKVQEYSAEEFRLLKDQIEASADSLGRVLIGGTHPTGTYTRTSSPFVTLSSDRRDINVSVTVHWKGGLSDSPYETTFSSILNKKDGMGTLKVLRDTAVFKIDPQFLRNTEYSLKDIFKPSR